MDIWKGAMTTARVASDIAWKDKTVYLLLRSPKKTINSLTY